MQGEGVSTDFRKAIVSDTSATAEYSAVGKAAGATISNGVKLVPSILALVPNGTKNAPVGIWVE